MAVIGIDLGTTNSLAACWKDDQVCLIPDEDGNILLPSVVSRTDEETSLVGRRAKERLHTKAEQTAASFKRFMGTEKEYLLSGQKFTPVELSALVLNRIKIYAERYLKEPVDEAIVTVPAYFNDKQRADTKKAAGIAGLHVERLINEPSAAALAYRNMQGGLSDGGEGNLIVFDFGGGTLDLSYVECFENIIEIVAVAGDNRLGGDDVDRLIATYYCTENKIAEDSLSANEYAELIRAAEAAKIALSSSFETDPVSERAAVPDRETKEQSEKRTVQIRTATGKPVTLDEDILFEICIPLFTRIKRLFLQLLKDTDMRISDIDALVMVGGSSKLSVVQRFLTELLGKEPVLPGSTDMVVAMGAGVYAGIRGRSEEVKDLILTDVCPFSLGIAANRHEQMCPIISRNTTLPAHRAERFVTAKDFQDTISVKIYQGEEFYAKDNLFLGRFDIAVPAARAGAEGIDVHFTYDINGILNVEAVNSRGEHKELMIANKSLSVHELAHYQKMLETMVVPAEEQQDSRALLERLQQAYENSAGEARARLGGYIDYFLRVLDSGRRTRIRKVQEQLEELLDSPYLSDEWQERLRFDGGLKWEEEDRDEEDWNAEENDEAEDREDEPGDGEARRTKTENVTEDGEDGSR